MKKASAIALASISLGNNLKDNKVFIFMNSMLHLTVNYSLSTANKFQYLL